MDGSTEKAVQVSNAAGASPFVLVCDHASNRIPDRYGDMGLTATERLSHIAWDPGALAVSMQMSDLLDAPLVFSTVSRLVIDANRVPTAEQAIWTLSEATRIAVNENLDAAERAHRVTAYHRPFHEAVTGLLDGRAERGEEAILVCMHSFTPVYLGVPRPWPIGLIHGLDDRFTAAFRDALAAEMPSLDIGWNQPYSALSGVTYTLEHHGDERDLPATMIEVRNDQILDPEGVALWSRRMAVALSAARTAFRAGSTAGPRAAAGARPS